MRMRVLFEGMKIEINRNKKESPLLCHFASSPAFQPRTALRVSHACSALWLATFAFPRAGAGAVAREAGTADGTAAIGASCTPL